ncbi:MAG TPA: protein-disulfide reductase DsbD N-terminal domain-containing protein [Terriglobales bacterium]
MWSLSTPLLAQDAFTKSVPSVSMVPAAIETITRGKSGTVDLQFRIPRGYHVNSHSPKSQFLVPTSLKLTAPTDILIGKVAYPPGEEMNFDFAPDEKLSVYTEAFILRVSVRPLAGVVPGKYAVRGRLRYQTCDTAACYPPKQLPVSFEVRIAKGAVAAPAKRNPRQSPHVHR